MASRLRLAPYCAIRIHSIKMCNTADIMIITSLARVNPSAIADINENPSKLYKTILK